MSVLIKVYDNQDYLGNIMVPLNMTYDRVIYLYRHIDKKRKAEALKNILDKHHISTEFIKVEDDSAYLAMNNNIVAYLYYYEDYAEMSSCIDFYMGKNIYDNLIYCIKWLINEGRFSKEYIK